ncbi:MAG: hypothetical protein MK105_12500 [Crocinitomicaceae bacterium]|nr:hypothetical protein [Crocinitomicaceae bacterium]
MKIYSNSDFEFILKIIEKYSSYYDFPYNAPVSYYNIFSLCNKYLKAQLKRDTKLYMNISSDNILTLIDEKAEHVTLVHPKAEKAVKSTVEGLVADGVKRISLHSPNFVPGEEYSIEQTFEQVLLDCHTADVNSEHNNELLRERLSKRSFANYRKNNREIRVEEISSSNISDLEKITDIWNKRAISRNVDTRSVFKDYLAIDLLKKGNKNLIGLIGYRGSNPVSFNIVTRMSFNPTVAVLLSSKSLNYKDQPGGYNETSVHSYIKLGEFLGQIGVSSLNLSGGNNTSSSLYSFKLNLGSHSICKSADYYYTPNI